MLWHDINPPRMQLWRAYLGLEELSFLRKGWGGHLEGDGDILFGFGPMPPHETLQETCLRCWVVVPRCGDSFSLDSPR